MSAQNIYNKLLVAIKNPYGVCGLMGNLKAESNLMANNLQNTYSKKFGLTDAEYTKKVDDGSYTNFVRDSAGYGLAQWTYWSRKQNLIDYAKSVGKSIGDEDMQIEFLLKEIKAYTSVWKVLLNACSVREASDVVLTQYERPANQSESVKIKRASYGTEFYEQFYCGGATEGKEETKVGFTNSPLVGYTNVTSKKTKNRANAIDRITPHCIVGQWTAKKGCDYFATTDRDCSSNYVIGCDGVIGLSVDEKDRSWCSSSSANDNRAVTIECASDAAEPYAFRDIVYEKLIELCTDICKRYGKKKLLWFNDKNTALNYKPKADEMVLTVHRWFAAKSCPGTWMYSRMGDLAAKVTAKLSGTAVQQPTTQPEQSTQTAGFKSGDIVVIAANATYYSGKAIPSWVKAKKWIVKSASGDRIVIDKSVDGQHAVCSPINAKFLSKEQAAAAEEFKQYKVRVSIKDLNIRSGAGTNFSKNGICPMGVFTIVAEANGTGATKWGKLKSGAGWISLDYVKKI